MAANPFRTTNAYGMYDDPTLLAAGTGGGGGGVNDPVFDPNSYGATLPPLPGGGGGLYYGSGGGAGFLQTPLSPSQTLVDPELLDVFSLAAAGPSGTAAAAATAAAATAATAATPHRSTRVSADSSLPLPAGGDGGGNASAFSQMTLTTAMAAMAASAAAAPPTSILRTHPTPHVQVPAATTAPATAAAATPASDMESLLAWQRTLQQYGGGGAATHAPAATATAATSVRTAAKREGGGGGAVAMTPSSPYTPPVVLPASGKPTATAAPIASSSTAAAANPLTFDSAWPGFGTANATAGGPDLFSTSGLSASAAAYPPLQFAASTPGGRGGDAKSKSGANTLPPLNLDLSAFGFPPPASATGAAASSTSAAGKLSSPSSTVLASPYYAPSAAPGASGSGKKAKAGAVAGAAASSGSRKMKTKKRSGRKGGDSDSDDGGGGIGDDFSAASGGFDDDDDDLFDGLTKSERLSNAAALAAATTEDEKDRLSKRLARKAELARASRRRKKMYVQDLENKVKKLGAKVEELQQRLSRANAEQMVPATITAEENTRAAAQQAIRAKLQTYVDKTAAADAQTNKEVSALLKKFVQNSRERQARVDFYLDRVHDSLMPGNQVKFAIWGLDQTDEFYAKPDGLWVTLMKQVGLNDQQINLLKSRRATVHAERVNLQQCQQLLKLVRGRMHAHLTSLYRVIDDINAALTPIQLAKLSLWVENNQWCLSLLNSLFTKE